MALDMNRLPLEDAAAMNAVYGRSDIGHGHEDPRWYAQNIVDRVPPYAMKFSWGPHCEKLKVHRLIHDPLMESLQAVFKLLGSQAGVEHYNMHLTGGAFMFRLMRGSSDKLSIHSWGAAIDIDPVHNPFPHKWAAGRGMLRMDVVQLFEKNGAHWRGKNGDDDPMHFQWARHHLAY